MNAPLFSTPYSMLWSFAVVLLSLVCAPFLSGIINRVKAKIGGRTGRPLLQLYYDLAKLLRKGAVYSTTSSLFFRCAGPAGVAAGVLALFFLPLGPVMPLFSFSGDFALLAGLFAFSRFFLIIAALDTGSAFEGMGAAREALFSAFAEPLFIFALMVIGYHTESFSLSRMLDSDPSMLCRVDWPFHALMSVAFFMLLLLENCRVPADDPNTHLELTMIHEVMILDHSGPDLALLEYAASLKLWVFSLIVSGILAPAVTRAVSGGATPHPLVPFVISLALIAVTAVFVGLVESLMARYRMERVPQVLTLAGSLICLSAMVLGR